MADVGIYTKNADIKKKAGVNANATSITVAETDLIVLNYEAMLNIATRYNWSAAVTAGPLDASVQGALTHVCACWIGADIIEDDMSGFTSRSEAQTMLDWLNNEVNRGISFLRNKKVQAFILGAP